MSPLQTDNAKSTIFGRITSVYIGLMLTVYLFCFDKTGYLHIVELKQKVFWLLCGGYPLSILITCLVKIIQREYTVRYILGVLLPGSLSQIFMLLFALCCILSTVFSQYPQYTLLGGSRGEGLITILFYVLSYYFVAKFFSFDKRLLWIISSSITVFSILCIVQLQGYNPFGLYPNRLTYLDKGVAYSGAYLGTIGNVGLVSAFLCIMIPLLFSLLIKYKFKAYYLILPLVLSVYVLIKMSVMAGFVGVFGSIILSLPMYFKNPKTRRILWISLLSLGFAFCLLLFFIDFSFDLFHDLHLLFHGKLTNSGGSGRIYIWKNVLARIPERPLLGHGADTLIFSDIPPFKRYDAIAGKLFLSYNDAAHNEYLNLLYHHGALALLSYIAALGVLLYRWFNNRKTTLIFVMGVAVIGYLLQAFFGISQLITAPYFWISLGILEASMKV